jgi:hypothetical protein
VRPALLALLVGAVPLTALPRPSFPGPSQSASGHVHFVVLASHIRPITITETRSPPARTFRGTPLLRLAGRLEIYGADGSSGRYVVAPGRYAFDFSKYAWPPKYIPADKEFVYEEVRWAREADTGILYAETAHSTYASSSYGLNGYLNAISLKTKKLLWRSPAQIANADDFVMLNTVVVSGYGFTNEPDYLYATNRKTGRVEARLLLPNAPEHITRRGGKLFVRTYDHNLVVKVEGA